MATTPTVPLAKSHLEQSKEMFLDLVASGYPRPEAADGAGISVRLARDLCRPTSDRYDPEFHARYEELTQPGGEYEKALCERIESAVVERALRKSDRLAEKLLAIYHARWEPYQPKQVSMNFHVDEFKMLIQNLPDDELRRMVEKYEQQLLPRPDDIQM